MSSQLNLLRERRYWPLFTTQFLGAFNDNLFKNALIVLLTFQTVRWTTMRPEVLSNLGQGIFMLPFFLFSATAGQWADKYDKARLARLVKILEIIIMLVAIAGFAIGSVSLLFFDLFLLGLHSTLFGPVKYAILPQVLHEDELIGGNALIEASTFIAILFGTICGGLLAGYSGGPVWIGYAGLLVAVLGLCASFRIPSAPAPVPDLKINLNPFVETWRNFTFARRSRAVFLAILGASWLWLYGLLFLAQIPVYAKDILGGNQSAVTLLLFTFSLGIGVGSMVCERLSGKQIEIGLVPFGSIGLTLFGLDLYFATPNALPPGAPLELWPFIAAPGIWRVLADLFLLGMFGGFYVVPLYAMIQARSENEYRARIIAALNVISAFFMVAGAVSAMALLWLGLSVNALFAVAALVNAGVAAYIFTLLPEFLLRFLDWLLVHTIYRLRVDGGERLPQHGAALLVCNSVSLVDVMIIAASCRRPIRFVVGRRLFKIPILSFVLRHGKAIGLDFAAANQPGSETDDQIRTIIKVLRAGNLVCVFPEQHLSTDGQMSAFRPFLGELLTKTNVQVIPMALTGLWGSFFSRKSGNALAKLWHGLRSSITLKIGASVAAHETSPDDLYVTIEQLCNDPDKQFTA